MFFTIWYGVYKNSDRELTYASGGHPPAILFEQTPGDDYRATRLRTPNYIIDGMSDSTYQKKNAGLANETPYTCFQMGCMKLKNQMDRF